MLLARVIADTAGMIDAAVQSEADVVRDLSILAMHELSIAQNVVEVATEAARSADAVRVRRVVLSVGRLTCVSAQSLRFCYELVVKDTMLEGSELEIRETPVVIFCSACDAERELPSMQSFRCPVCGASSSEVRRGNELELETIEVEDSDNGEHQPSDSPNAAVSVEAPK